MEDHYLHGCDAALYRQVQARHGNLLGVVLRRRAYMRRTLRDIAELPREAANVAAVQGHPTWSRGAWRGRAYETALRANFVAALGKLIEQGVYPAGGDARRST